MSRSRFIIEDLEVLKRNIAQLPRILGNETVDFFKENIDKQTDIHGKPYEGRRFTTAKQAPKKILKDRHNLYDSIKILSITPNEIIVGINDDEVPYAEAHNEGATIEITDKMRKYFWAMHYKLKGSKEDESNFYKNLALKKTAIKIPQRQFMGDSPELDKRLEAEIIKAISVEVVAKKPWWKFW